MTKIELFKTIYLLLIRVGNEAMFLVLGGPYRKNQQAFSRLNSRETFRITKKFRYPMLLDRYRNAGTLGSYFWQDLWAAKMIYKANPAKHYDIGSRIDGFIAHLASFRENITLIDIRPLSEKIPGVNFIQADATNLENIPDNSIESLSSLCALEHFGLGRYGDPVDPDACFKAFAAIQRVVKPGGLFYLSVPVGMEHVEFDAHRIFYAQTIVDSMPKMQLLQYAVVTSKGGIEQNVGLHDYDSDSTSRGDRFGLFLFQKKI